VLKFKDIPIPLENPALSDPDIDLDLDIEETFYYPPESGFGKPQGAHIPQGKQQLPVRSMPSAVNLLHHNPSPPGKMKKSHIESIIAINETAAVRNIGITFETRPDHLSGEAIDRVLEMGATKVEVGVQSIYDRVLKKIDRGHTVQDAIDANKRLRDSGLKVGFHIMVGLPGSGVNDDLDMFKTLFSDPAFCPDHLKIYPTLVTEGTVLHQWWKDGSYQSLDNDSAIGLLADIKSVLPKWVRLQRIQRDIPAQQIVAGVTKSNIRQLAEERLMSRGGSCTCIRCREVGHASLRGRAPEKIELLVETYHACGGTENFISFEDGENNILIGFLRLRFPDSPHRIELANAALVRELVVYGSMVPLGADSRPRGISGSIGAMGVNCSLPQRILRPITDFQKSLSQVVSVYVSTTKSAVMHTRAHTW